MEAHDEGALGQCLSDYEMRLDRGEAPDLGAYREQLSDGFGEFASVLETRAAIFELIEPPVEESLPRAFGHFTLRRVLGSGGAGVVYEAHNNRLDRTEAVKVLHPDAGESGSAVQRFQREARACARADDPHVVAIHQFGEIDGRPYFSMEYIDGRTLKDVAAEGGTDPRTVFEQMAPVVEALGALHRAGVVHRDVKPSNIMVRADGSYVLMDFGLVRNEFLATLTDANSALGTPYYMSPEQMRGDRVTPQADIYAVGATLYHVLAGEPPFEADTITELASKVYNEQPRPLTRSRLDIPADANRLVLKCLQKEPADRYADAAALGDDLIAFAKGGEVRGRPVGALRRVGRKLRARALPIALAACVLVALGILWSQRDGQLRVEARGFVADLIVDGAPHGKTPRTLELAKGLRHVTYRVARFQDRTQDLEIASGAQKEVALEIWMFQPESEGSAALGPLGAGVGVPFEPMQLEWGRSAEEGAASIVYPRGALRVQDLTTLRLEIYLAEQVADDAAVVVRRGGDELARLDPGDRLASVLQIPDGVRSAVKPGDELELVFGEARATVRIVADADVAKTLAELDEKLSKQPAWVQLSLRFSALAREGLHHAALQLALARRDGSQSLLPHLLARMALGASDAGGSKLAREIEAVMDTFPESERDAWLADAGDQTAPGHVGK